MPLAPQIRSTTELTDAEVGQLAEILAAAVAEGASIGWVDPPGEDEAAAYWRGTLRPETHLLLAELDGRVVGTAQLALATRANGLHRAEVNKLIVHPRHHRRGIGRSLLAEVERLAASLDRTLLHLDTREGDPSNQLYLSAGWTETGRIPRWCTGTDGQLAATVIYYKDIP